MPPLSYKIISDDRLRTHKRDEFPSWLEQHQNQVERATVVQAELVFLGDSIPKAWLTPEKGAEVASQAFTGVRWDAYGMGGDHIEMLHWRLVHGLLNAIKPKAIVLLIGTNNLPYNTDDWIVEGMDAVTTLLRTKLPSAHLLVVGILPKVPRRPERTDELNQRIQALNRRMSYLAASHGADFLDLTRSFLDATAAPNRQLLPDGVHPNAEGYRVWAARLKPWLAGIFPITLSSRQP